MSLVWVGSNATLAVVSEVLTVTRTGSAPALIRNNPGLAGLSGATSYLIRIPVMKTAGLAPGASWVGRLSYTTLTPSVHGFSSSFNKVIPAPKFALNTWGWLELDMRALTAGGTDWTDSTIDQLKLEIDDDPSSAWSLGEITYGRISNAPIVDTHQAKPNAFTKTAYASDTTTSTIIKCTTNNVARDQELFRETILVLGGPDGSNTDTICDAQLYVTWAAGTGGQGTTKLGMLVTTVGGGPGTGSYSAEGLVPVSGSNGDIVRHCMKASFNLAPGFWDIVINSEVQQPNTNNQASVLTTIFTSLETRR